MSFFRNSTLAGVLFCLLFSSVNATEFLEKFTPQSISNNLAKVWSLDNQKKNALELYFLDVLPLVKPIVSQALAEAKKSGKLQTDDDAYLVTVKAISSLTDKGYPQLNAYHQKTRYTVTSKVLEKLPPAYCRNFVLGGLFAIPAKEYRKVEKTLYRDMDISLYQAMLDSQKAAIQRALNPAEKTFVPTQEQMEAGMEELVDKLIVLFKEQGYSEKDMLKMFDVMEHLKTASPRDACDAGKFLLKALQNVEGPAGEWIISVYTKWN